jgi:hypothetical protein
MVSQTQAMPTSVASTLFIFFLAGSHMAASQAAPLRLSVGHAFPELAFPSADNGTPMSIAQYRGKKILLHIFASW